MARLLERTVGLLADRLDRRGFLSRAAVVGSAAVVAPVDFALRPTTAYAAVCRCNGSSCPCGSLCCDGYTEFCCTSTGVNACPAGTITAGWWKVDGSQFCGGAARYYLDCNAQCGSCSCGSNGVCSGACSGTPCGCAQGRCTNRKGGCTRFRYGQCNQAVRCVGPIVCRVVTCAPPWSFDPSCGTSSRTDSATRFHDRPCLNEPFGEVNSVVDAGGQVRVAGWVVANLDYQRAGVQVFLGSRKVHDGSAALARPDVARAYPAVGGTTGFDVTVRADPGKHLVCVWGVDRRNGRRSFIGFREVVVAATDVRLNSVTDQGDGTVRVVGWATDPTRLPDRRATVRFRVDGVEVRRGPTDRPRPDVVAKFPRAHPTSGFDVVLTVAPGTRTLCVDVVDRFGTVRPGPCRTVTVAAVPPTTVPPTTTTTTVPPTTTTTTTVVPPT